MQKKFRNQYCINARRTTVIVAVTHAPCIMQQNTHLPNSKTLYLLPLPDILAIFWKKTLRNPSHRLRNEFFQHRYHFSQANPPVVQTSSSGTYSLVCFAVFLESLLQLLPGPQDAAITQMGPRPLPVIERPRTLFPKRIFVRPHSW